MNTCDSPYFLTSDPCSRYRKRRRTWRSPEDSTERQSPPGELADAALRPWPARRQQRYDHRLRDLIQRTGDLTIATDLGVPRSTARGGLGAAPTAVVSLEVPNLTEPELRQELLTLRRRVEKLAALLRLAITGAVAAFLEREGIRIVRTPARTPSCNCPEHSTLCHTYMAQSSV